MVIYDLYWFLVRPEVTFSDIHNEQKMTGGWEIGKSLPKVLVSLSGDAESTLTDMSSSKTSMMEESEF